VVGVWDRRIEFPRQHTYSAVFISLASLSVYRHLACVDGCLSITIAGTDLRLLLRSILRWEEMLPVDAVIL
jgi:hypothetical protein